VIAEGIAEYMDENDPLLRDVPRDEHGHIRLAEVPIARVLRTAVAESLGKRGIKIAIGEKDVGYEVRCGYPGAFDRDYTRDLGVGAVRTLLAGSSSVLITRQAHRIVPVPFKAVWERFDIPPVAQLALNFVAPLASAFVPVYVDGDLAFVVGEIGNRDGTRKSVLRVRG